MADRGRWVPGWSAAAYAGGHLADDAGRPRLRERGRAGLALGAGVAAATEVACCLARGAAGALVAANKSARALAVETVRTLPRLTRLGRMNDRTRISLGRIIAEQAGGARRRGLLFDGRAHLRGGRPAHQRRCAGPGRRRGAAGCPRRCLDGSRPSALVAITALSRLGAVAVLMPPDVDLATAARMGGVSEIIADPRHLDAARGLEIRVLVLGGGESRRSAPWTTPKSSTWRRSTPTASNYPACIGRTRFSLRPCLHRVQHDGRRTRAAKQITNFRWALSAFGTASTAARLGGR